MKQKNFYKIKSDQVFLKTVSDYYNNFIMSGEDKRVWYNEHLYPIDNRQRWTSLTNAILKKCK